MERRVEIASGPLRLAGVLHAPAGPGPLPGVVCAHGLDSGKESRKFVELARILSGETSRGWGLPSTGRNRRPDPISSENAGVGGRGGAEHPPPPGMAVLRFDQRGCGESPGDPKDWEGRFSDLRAAVAFLRGQQSVEVGPVGLVGSSFGGYISVRVAAEGGIGALVGLASAARMPGMADGLEAASRVRCPALFIHGTADMVVPPDRSKQLWERVQEVRRLEFMEGADHRFSEEEHRQRAVQLVAKWFEKHLSKSK